ncbi:MAG TPA: DNA repair exonuclease [Pyrinomonadaceae bacterium]
MLYNNFTVFQTMALRFLHISDVHLGCTRYHLEESPRDFFRAWYNVLQDYAVAERVDFVLMCGDFFHKRNVDPQAMNHAVAGLQLLKDHNIPVVCIEGNHDQTPNDTDHSWIRSLASWKLLILLEPKTVADKDGKGKFEFQPWDAEDCSGSFVDIKNARIFGSTWYGASANTAIPMLTAAIKENRREGAFHILMLHTDVEGHQTHPIPALTLTNLKELKSLTDYVGLGHTHKRFEIDNWAFNPGSLEVTSIDEYREERGAFLVEVSDDGAINAQHLRDYVQRPFHRLAFDVSGIERPEEITTGVMAQIEREVTLHNVESKNPAPILEIRLTGHLGFKNSLLETDKIRAEAQKLTNSLHVRLKNFTAPIEYAIAADLDENATREERERRVIEDLIARDNRYKENAREMAELVVGAKRLALSDEPPEKIYELIALKA